MVDLKDKVVIITGGSKGIGRETAKLYAKKGAKVIITGRSLDALVETSQLINDSFGKADYVQGDVTNIDDCKKVIEFVSNKYKKIDVLINNAGMSMRGTFEDTTLELFKTMVDINLMGSVHMTKLALPHLIESSGSIVFVSSLTGLKGMPGIAPYSTAKMALTGFSESIRAELYQYDIHVGIVYVGLTENDSHKTIYDAKGQRIPLRRTKNNDTQEDVARSILKMVRKRKTMMYLTSLGKIAKFFYKFFPRLSSYILRKYTMKSEMYKS